MKLDKVANSGNDEFYTPIYAIIPILKYIKPIYIYCLSSTLQRPLTLPVPFFYKLSSHRRLFGLFDPQNNPNYFQFSNNQCLLM